MCHSTPIEPKCPAKGASLQSRISGMKGLRANIAGIRRNSKMRTKHPNSRCQMATTVTSCRPSDRMKHGDRQEDVDAKEIAARLILKGEKMLLEGKEK
jgi:hypothetical protein